jgi:hypothetical protein
MITILITFLVGFVTGFLVFRNNSKKILTKEELIKEKTKILLGELKDK